LAAENLTETQYAKLTQEQHPVTDWNQIILAIKVGRFDTGTEYKEIKLRAGKKSVFSQAFTPTPRKRVTFAMEGGYCGRAGCESRSLVGHSESAETASSGV
jgi:hypothetical protein